jgi:uncharacterized protein YoxC
MYLEIFLIISGIAIILLLIFCIPVLIQIWRTTRDVAVTLETLNQDLPMILKNLEEITANINNSTAAVNREVQNFTDTIGRFQFVVKNVVNSIENIAPKTMNLPVFQTARNVFAVAKGVRAFLYVFFNTPRAKG